MKRLRIGVVYGGRSSEHEVSLASASAVIANLDPDRYEAVPVYIRRDGRWSLADKPPATLSAADVIEHSRSGRRQTESARPRSELHFVAYPADAPILTIQREAETGDGEAPAVVGALGVDVVFPVVHGPYGEDGTLQGLLELANVPYVGAGVLASAVGMDKAVARTLFEARGLPVVDHTVVEGHAWQADSAAVLNRLEKRLKLPLFVKPANLGSSVGISKARDRGQLERAIDLARQFDSKIVVESAVPHARELECAVLGNTSPEASVVGEIVPVGEFYDYESKYLNEGSKLTIPAPLASKQAAAIRAMALEAFRAIEGAGMARVDFLMAGDREQVYLNEVNTIPGFTTISMYAKLWQHSGLGYPQLLDRLIALALERHEDKQQLRTSMT